MGSKLNARQKADLFLATMKAVINFLIMAAFFAAMAYNNAQILRLSRTMAVTMLTYITMAVVMNTVYGGYAVGKKKSKPVISSMSLAVIVTDIMTYLQLQIMNTNPDNNENIVLFGGDFLLLMLAMVVQIMLIVFFVRLGNNMYFRIIPPDDCCLIAGEDIDLKHLLSKIDKFKLQYNIKEVIACDAPMVNEVIGRNKTVFLCGVPEEQRNTLILQCYRMKKNIMCLAELEDIMILNAQQSILIDVPFLEMEYRTMTWSQRIAKRLLDLIFSGLCILITSPLMLISAVAVFLQDRGSPIYKQKRVTYHGRVFDVYKFRTMTREATYAVTEHCSTTVEDARVTKVGAVLRKYHLDELPQLFNVFKGEMAIVGPRPEMVENVTKYKEELPTFVYRERVKAGITGYAQIEGKYNTTPKDKLMLDLIYIQSFSLWLDIKLIFRTLTVFFRKDSTEGFLEQPFKKHEDVIEG